MVGCRTIGQSPRFEVLQTTRAERGIVALWFLAELLANFGLPCQRTTDPPGSAPIDR
jgi:hypothetical protein